MQSQLYSHRHPLSPAQGVLPEALDHTCCLRCLSTSVGVKRKSSPHTWQ